VIEQNVKSEQNVKRPSGSSGSGPIKGHRWASGPNNQSKTITTV